MVQPKIGLSLETKLMVWATLIVLLVLSLAGFMLITNNVKNVKEDIKDKALFIARTMAKSPATQAALVSDNPSAILQPFAEQVRLSTEAAFIVISNMDEIRLTHPLAEKIGTPMANLYREPVLKGEEYIYIGQGSLAPSLRANVPVFDSNEPSRQIGFISVGFFLDKIEKTIISNIVHILAVLLLALGLSVIGSILLAKNVKRAIFGLEPWEIAGILQEKNATLEAIHEGVVAVDIHSCIRIINKEALQLLGLQHEQAIGLPLKQLLPNCEIDRVLTGAQSLCDKEQFVGQTVFLANIIPITVDGQVTGAVITFRDRTEMVCLAEELTGVNKLVDTLRAQSHEFKNKLHTISGLIQLEKYAEATELITKHSEASSKIFELQTHIGDSLTFALLAGKASRCAELGIQFTISPDSSLTRLPGRLISGDLVIILGNLLENAMEAVKAVQSPEVYVGLQEDSTGLHIIVQNTGPWIPSNFDHAIYERGMSTKGMNRGLGLALIKEKVCDNNGSIQHRNLPEGGVEFRVFIPVDKIDGGDLDA